MVFKHTRNGLGHTQERLLLTVEPGYWRICDSNSMFVNCVDHLKLFSIESDGPKSETPLWHPVCTRAPRWSRCGGSFRFHGPEFSRGRGLNGLAALVHGLNQGRTTLELDYWAPAPAHTSIYIIITTYRGAALSPITLLLLKAYSYFHVFHSLVF